MHNIRKSLPFFIILFVLLVPISGLSVVNPQAANKQINFWVFSDIHLDVTKATPMEINPHGVNWSNDLDKATFNSELEQISSAFEHGLLPAPDFILILGDIAGYDRSYTYETYDNEMAVFQALKQKLPKSIPLIMTFGNNDSLEKDYGSFYYAPGIRGLHSSYEIAMASGWLDGFLSTGTHCSFLDRKYPCIIDENRDDGYFSMYLASGLKLLSLNSVMFAASSHNTSTQDIANKQLSWLENELLFAKIKNEHVLIATHVPFGNNIYDDSKFWRDIDRDAFYRLLSSYQNIIIGMFCGHTHLEELKVLQDSKKHNVGALVYTAGLSTSHGNAPSIKDFSLVDQVQDWSVADYSTYYFLNDAANVFSLWKLYDYAQYYCSGISIKNLFSCLKNVTSDKIYNYYSAGNPNYNGTIKAPGDIFVTLPDVNNTSSDITTSSHDSNNLGTIIGVSAGVGAAALGIYEMK